MNNPFEKYSQPEDFTEKFGLVGKVYAYHYDKDWNLVEQYVSPNTACNTGKAQIAGYISGIVANNTNMFKYLAIGTGTTAAATTDTTLVSEVGTRVTATNSRQTTTYTNDTSRLLGTFTFNASTAITEAGVFDASTTGTVCARQTVGTLSMASGDSLVLQWDLRLT